MDSSIKRTPLAAAIIIALNAPLYSSVANADLPLPGDRVGIEFPVNTETSSNQERPSIAMDADGDFVVVWDSKYQDGDHYGIYAQRYSANGIAAGVEFQVNTETSSRQSFPSIAMDADGDFVVAWQSLGQDGSGYGIYAQRYNADGSKADTEFQVNTYITNAQHHPSIAMDADGDFVISWQSRDQDGDSHGIVAQRYSADGNAAGVEFQVNTETSGDQARPSIAMDADGGFVVAWNSMNQDGSGYGIYAQRYNADGATAGIEFQVSTYTSSSQRDSSIAMDADGDFVVAWQSYTQDTTMFGIYAQRYSANGATAGNEFQVNTTVTDTQISPSVAMDADGDFVVAWASNWQDGDVNGVIAQRYNADGTVAGNEFQVNSFATNNQKAPSIAMDADGDFVVAWQSYGQDGSDYGIYAQRYLGAGETVDLNLIVQDDTDPVTVGDNFVYSLITTNNGSGIAMDVNLNTDLPSGLTYVSDDSASIGWNCTELSTTLNCNKPFMTPAEMNTINITVQASAAGTQSNTVTASAGQVDTNAADNTDTETTEVEAKVVAPSDDDDGVLGIGSMQGLFSLLIALPLWLRHRFKA